MSNIPLPCLVKGHTVCDWQSTLGHECPNVITGMHCAVCHRYKMVGGGWMTDKEINDHD